MTACFSHFSGASSFIRPPSGKTGNARRSSATAAEQTQPIPELSREEELSAYRQMLLIRRFEEKAGQLYGMGLIGGFCHLYIGQEAVVVGMQMAISEGDQVITGYRDHGHMLACGMDPKGVMAELTGRAGGYSQGKGGSMHMFCVEKQFYRRPRHRRRPGAARHRPGLRQQIHAATAASPHLFRRRRGQSGPGLRGLQHGGAVEAAGGLHHREQQIRHGHLGRARPPPDRLCPSRRAASASPASRWTAWTCWRREAGGRRPWRTRPRAARGRPSSTC